MIKIVGLDLAAKVKNPTGVAILNIYDFNKEGIDSVLNVSLAHENSEIIHATENATLVAIDAPLTFPKKGIARELDKTMMSKGFRVFPALFSYMKDLTKRGAMLAEKLMKKGLNVIEVHPRSSMKIMDLSPVEVKKMFFDKLQKAPTLHEIDAVVCALTGLAYYLNEFIEIRAEDGRLILPKKEFKDVLETIHI